MSTMVVPHSLSVSTFTAGKSHLHRLTQEEVERYKKLYPHAVKQTDGVTEANEVEALLGCQRIKMEPGGVGRCRTSLAMYEPDESPATSPPQPKPTKATAKPSLKATAKPKPVTPEERAAMERQLARLKMELESFKTMIDQTKSAEMFLPPGLAAVVRANARKMPG